MTGETSEASEHPVPRAAEDELRIAEWQAAYARVRDLVAATDDAALEERVPACPGWTGRELLAHMVGLGSDVVDGDEPDDHNEAWTQAQVDARADRSPADLLAEWAATAPRLVTWMRARGTRPLNDVVIHEQDLRGALDAPGGRDSRGLALVREGMAGRVGSKVTDLPPLALVANDEDWSWCSSGPVEDAAVRLEASGFDLARALVSRRTPQQLASWTVTGDVSAYLAAFAHLGPPPDGPLPE
ncbi:maleylpyruvate isomerase family mycothiol-dependent enzyme [Nocardioides sp. HDW12B]|uniref:maleylpyruvate isomerase family mycothiol-dependent enzyme n=1 Tax=Nocardioides sp. HDW12B TaxID=2714939 RepID=UPI00140AA019|nr:maleylpyruvate isomerase family mycothiol-dependent enzyme [Nocardioides sp. HDW12B]QIK65037.1 maleylpyruvate isomerase family mycothiol-dependent enzyme [Nocardioides sp. HDW12B]